VSARVLTIRDAPSAQTVAIAREALDAVLVWEPRRWLPDVPQPPEWRIPQDGDDA
jgi:hypothetical protein